MSKDKENAGINRRRQVRVEADLMVRYSGEDGTFVEECVGNVSWGGVFIETLRPRPLNEILELFFVIPATSEEFTVQGEVVHVVSEVEDEKQHGRKLGMGIRFMAIEPREKDLLRRYLEALLQVKGPGTREHARFFKRKSIQVKPRSVDEFRNRYMTIIGRGGLLFESEEDLTLFDPVDLVLISPRDGSEIQLSSEVVNIRRLEGAAETNLKGIGVRFLDLDPTKQAAIDQFIREMLTEDR